MCSVLGPVCTSCNGNLDLMEARGFAVVLRAVVNNPSSLSVAVWEASSIVTGLLLAADSLTAIWLLLFH